MNCVTIPICIFPCQADSICNLLMVSVDCCDHPCIWLGLMSFTNSNKIIMVCSFWWRAPPFIIIKCHCSVIFLFWTITCTLAAEPIIFKQSLEVLIFVWNHKSGIKYLEFILGFHALGGQAPPYSRYTLAPNPFFFRCVSYNSASGASWLSRHGRRPGLGLQSEWPSTFR